MMLSCEIIAYVEEYTKALTALSGKPSYAWGRPSTVSASTWLDNNTIPSNRTGIPFGLSNGLLTELWVGNSELVQYDIALYYHYGDETGLTLLTELTVPSASRTKTFGVADFGIVNIPLDCQLAARVTNVPGSSPKNVSVHATPVGTT